MERSALPPVTSAALSSSSSAALLHRLAHDAHDSATPLGAFLAGLPPVPKRRPKTSSERGRAFRERQQRREDELARAVAVLRREVARMDMHLKVRQTRCLTRRAGPTGSLVGLACEYHRLFARGLGSGSDSVGNERLHRSRATLQERFLRSAIDESAIVGNMVGPEASIVQWRRYTESHDAFALEVTGIEVSESRDEFDGDGESVVSVAVQCVVRGRLSRNSFAMLFPHVARDSALLDRLVGLEVSYPTSRRFQFTRDGRIAVETVDVDFVTGLNRAGVSLADVATLLQGSALTRDSMIVEVPEPPAYHEKQTHRHEPFHPSAYGRETSFPYYDTLAA